MVCASTARAIVLTARHLARRQRRAGGGLLVYRNLKDLVLSDARIELNADPLERANPNGKCGSELLFENLSILDPLADAQASAADLLAGRADVDLDLVTRVSFEELSLVVRAAAGETLRITAPRASFNIGSKHLHLSAPTLVTSDGRTLTAATGLWPVDTAGSAFLEAPERTKVSRGGMLIGPLRFAAVLDPGAWPGDALERMERELLTNVLSHLPPIWRPLLSALGVASAPDAAASFECTSRAACLEGGGH